MKKHIEQSVESAATDAFSETGYRPNDDYKSYKNGFIRGAQWQKEQLGWISVKDSLPEVGINVWGALQHWHTKNYRYYELKRVDESDCNWRTSDDNSEISYDWTVTHWQPLPEKPKN